MMVSYDSYVSRCGHETGFLRFGHDVTCHVLVMLIMTGCCQTGFTMQGLQI